MKGTVIDINQESGRHGMPGDKRFAVLIDADNVSSKYVQFILNEIANDGVATYKRIYGDWTGTALSPWKAVLLDHSITPIQQYAYTSGKNATDSAMIIDAMDILYSGNVEGFCIVSSDSDFTRLAARLREAGMTVVGMGERKTPQPFVKACDKFRYLEVLVSEVEAAEPPVPLDVQPKQQEMTDVRTIRRAIATLITENSDEDGLVLASQIGNALTKRYPDFDVRNYGFKKFTPFIKSLGMFEVRPERKSDSGATQYLIRIKDTGQKPETQERRKKSSRRK